MASLQSRQKEVPSKKDIPRCHFQAGCGDFMKTPEKETQLDQVYT